MQSKTMELQQILQRSEGYIKFLEGTAILLLCFYFVQILHQVFAFSTASLFDTLGRVGILISVLLASQVARRQLTFNKIVENQKQKDTMLRVTHHLAMVSTDLVMRLKALHEDFNNVTFSPTFSKFNVEIIKERHAVFYDREIYEVLPTSVVMKIKTISTEMFTLIVFSSELLQRIESKLVDIDLINQTGGTIAAQAIINKVIEVLDSVNDDLAKYIIDLNHDKRLLFLST